MVALYWNLGLGVIICVSMVVFAMVSAGEREPRAMRMALGLAVVGGAWLFIVPLISAWVLQILMVTSIIGMIFLIGILILPEMSGLPDYDPPQRRIDERDIMFSRGRLKQGSPEYTSYYQMRPKNQSVDDALRKRPGLLKPGANLFHHWGAKTSHALFEIPDLLRHAVDGAVEKDSMEKTPLEWSELIRSTAQYFGAKTVGICELKPYHVYTHIGRGTGTYGDAIQLTHKFAIAFTLEMDADCVASGPEIPITMESARQYGRGAVIAVELAKLIRSVGYEARAHIDGNYRVIAPLVARDAGLGELGRMGILMTPELGPRVRLGVVTTDLPLVPSKTPDFRYMIHFCELCKKCANNCPSRSISERKREPIDGVTRWKINQESCYRYWCTVGTDCGKCMAVCPFSHPDNPAHNLVRWAISRSKFMRYLANWMDDFFYGRRPQSKAFPSWIPKI